MRARKVHRRRPERTRYHRALCALGWRGTDNVSDEQFVWLPRRYQCTACLNRYWPSRWIDGSWRVPHRVDRRSATAEMQTTVETIVLAIHRLAECPAVPHRHVWLPYRWGVEGVDTKLNPWRCTCGGFSCDGASGNAGGEQTGESFYGIDRSVAPPGPDWSSWADRIDQ